MKFEDRGIEQKETKETKEEGVESHGIKWPDAVLDGVEADLVGRAKVNPPMISFPLRYLRSLLFNS